MPELLRKTPIEEFKTPILTALRDLGGEAKAYKVLDLVEKRMNNFLTYDDKVKLASGMVRWRKSAHFAKLELRDQRLIESSSSGVWRLLLRNS